MYTIANKGGCLFHEMGRKCCFVYIQVAFLEKKMDEGQASLYILAS
jgi:hypothetical protein